jgi:type IV pilus assembly protein PilY1
VKVIAGANDGGIRVINSNNGKEEFIFFPPSTLAKQPLMRLNPTSSNKVYGVDGSPTPWVRDSETPGVIEPLEGDFVRVFTGMRRGGNEIFGLDLTPTQKILPGQIDALDKITPKLMWRVKGGAKRNTTDTLPEYARLGQTWSQPLLAAMLVGTDTVNEAKRRAVLIFGGGYEATSQDSGFQPVSGSGNAIYIADAQTGERLFFASGPGSLAQHSDVANAAVDGVEVQDMVYAIPSDVAAFDSDGDLAVDRIYVGDSGGQMWRLDIRPNRAASQRGVIGTVGKLAEVSGAPGASPLANADKRRFFYPPSVISVRAAGSQSTGNFDLVSAVTGFRASPLNKDVRDRFYAFRDPVIKAMPLTDVDGDGVLESDANGDGLSDTYETILGGLDGDPGNGIPSVASNQLVDLTQENSLEDVTIAPTFDLRGYFIRLDTGGAGNGEKGLAAPVTISGKLFFTTYLPDGVVSQSTCSLAEGQGKIYGIDAVTGAAIFNWDNDPSGELTKNDKSYTLGAGIPSTAVPVFFPDSVQLLVGVGGGAESLDPDIPKPQGRTYWFQDEQDNQ